MVIKMNILYNLPKRYKPGRPMFHENGKVSERVRGGLENVLDVYTKIAEMQSRVTDNNLANYVVRNVYIVGSGARNNRIDSDMDLLLLVPRLDEGSAKNIRVMMTLMFFADKPKPWAIDVFIRKEDIYPDRESIEVTRQLESLIDQYNRLLLSPKEAISS